MGDKYEKLDTVWISADHRQITRIPQSTSGPEETSPLYVLIIVVVVLAALALFVVKKKKS